MFKVKTDYPIAYESPDHTNPHGTKNDNSKNRSFVNLMNQLYLDAKIIDIGCAGGGMIEDFVNNGNLAIGLEGSDYSQKLKRAAWETIPNNLFTCDASKPFEITYEDKPFLANVISMWEVLEHFTDETIDQVLQNVINHLEVGGLLIGSISTSKEGNEPWHNCVHPAEWWEEKLASFNFEFRSSIKDRMDRNDAWVRFPGGHYACHQRIK